ncbi:hypothetical protein [uncultured Parabacteroides sp.]|uniref:hypothetical protein n=1 Tax=uncultured Parabacteroides sp. TaxID=512312 RepID=UPI00258D9219|nr:hypothetical protein [uncultured Parabacteroides sp.]
MKKRTISVILLFLFAFLQVNATGLSGDVIYIQEKSWGLLNKPIWADSTLYAQFAVFLPENHCVSTANWDGYTAFWEIQNDSLFLQKIEVCIYDKKELLKDSTLTLEAEQLKTVFAPYYKQGKIHARWYTGELRAAQGELIRYVHSGFNRNTETEQIITLQNGLVLQSEIYHNYKKSGLTLKDAQHEIIERFPWSLFPEYKGWRFSFYIRNLQVTEDGHLSDCDVELLYIKSENEKVAGNNHAATEAFKETLKTIYPWEVLYIHNQFTTSNTNFVMPIQEKNDNKQ